ncbi:hypothetical protein KP509_36G022000 [Ceratopteris richardii]|nr:hypothetical protein KP509_36G022000 [Ceratopteris richardii]
MQGRLIHFIILENGYDTDLVVGNAIISLYASCGLLKDACSVFILMVNQDIVSWCSLILGCVEYGYNTKALELLERMQQECIEPNRVTFLYALRACANMANLDRGKLVHINLTKQGLESDIFIGSTLVAMYGKCKCIKESRKVFDCLRTRSMVSWSAMIVAYIENGNNEEALTLFHGMKEQGLEPDKGVYACVLKACGTSKSYDGAFVHIDAVKKGFDLDLSVGNCLINMYSGLGSLDDANKVFDTMPVQDVVSWLSMIEGNIKNNWRQKAFFLFDEMLKYGIKAEATIFVGILDACSQVLRVCDGMLMHSEVVKRGFEINSSIVKSLVFLYASCGHICDAWCMLEATSNRDVTLWNVLITRCSESGHNKDAVKLFQIMQHDGICGNRITFLSVLKSCSMLEQLEQGRLTHAIMTMNGFLSETSIENALLHMYSQCGSIHDTCKVFNIMPKRDVVSWSSIIFVHAKHSDFVKASESFELMQKDGVEPNEFTFVSILYACCSLAEIKQGLLLHHYIIHAACESNLHVGSVLCDLYCMCGSVDDACQLFDMMSERNVVLWSTILSLGVKHRYDKEVLSMFQMMQMEGIEPNEVTYTLVLISSANMCNLDFGKYLHMELSKRGYDLDTFTGNTLVDMYAKCGSLCSAFSVLATLHERTLVSWNALISGLADHGMLTSVLYCFVKMQEKGIKADSGTFVSILSACSHEGLIEEGFIIFESMDHYDVCMSHEHYICLIDILGRAGFLYEVEACIYEILMQPDWLIWMTLLGSCAKYNNVDVGYRAFHVLVKSACKKDAVYVLMSNIFSANKMWEDAKNVREMYEG